MNVSYFVNQLTKATVKDPCDFIPRSQQTIRPFNENRKEDSKLIPIFNPLNAKNLWLSLW